MMDKRYVNVKEHRPEKILVFPGLEGIEIIKNCTQMFGDGTFSVMEKMLFFQLFVITTTTPISTLKDL